MIIIITLFVRYSLKSCRCCPLTPFRFFLERFDVLEAQNMKKSEESEPNKKKLEENVETSGSDTRGIIDYQYSKYCIYFVTLTF